jgi:hypothetical protein
MQPTARQNVDYSFGLKLIVKLLSLIQVAEIDVGEGRKEKQPSFLILTGTRQRNIKMN